MSKPELIERIREINRGATAEFLSTFTEEQLRVYLRHLMTADVREEVAVAD